MKAKPPTTPPNSASAPNKQFSSQKRTTKPSKPLPSPSASNSPVRANRLEAALAVDGIDPLLAEANEKTLNRIATYRMRAERTFHKCLKEIQTYQAVHPLDEPVSRNEPKLEMQNEPNWMQPTIHEHKFKREPYVRPAPKIGRNELCACKSGRKYKNCCLRNEANSVTAPVAA